MLRISPYQANCILDSYRIGRLKVFIELFPLDHSTVSNPDNIVAFGLIGHIPQLPHADTGFYEIALSLSICRIFCEIPTVFCSFPNYFSEAEEFGGRRHIPRIEFSCLIDETIIRMI